MAREGSNTAENRRFASLPVALYALCGIGPVLGLVALARDGYKPSRVFQSGDAKKLASECQARKEAAQLDFVACIIGPNP